MPDHLTPTEQRRLKTIEAAIAKHADKAAELRKERRYLLSKARVRKVRAEANSAL
jgi:hypothetical protein